MATPAGSGDAPSEWLVRHAASRHFPAGGRALDLAAGTGRHAHWLAARGFRVVAIDVDPERLAAIGAPTGGADRGRAGVETAVVDLEAGEATLVERLGSWAASPFDLVVVCNYLHRPLLPQLAGLLRGGGVLVYETFARGHERLGRPRRPEFLLEPGELLRVVENELAVLAYEHGAVRTPRPSVRQRLVAQKRQGSELSRGGPPAAD